MFKTGAAFAAITALLSCPAMAQTLKAGQYYGETQYTDLYDPSGPTGPCASLITVGAVTPTQATLTIGLGGAFTRVVAVPSAVAAGVTVTPCTAETIPGTGYTLQTNGTYTAPTSSTLTCSIGTSGASYVLTSGNTGTVNGQNVSDSLTILPASVQVPNIGGIAMTTAFKETTIYSTLTVGAITCYVSTDSIYIRSGV